MTTLNSRCIAEHLCMLASLLAAEAMRANTLGLKEHKNIMRQAEDVRRMANQLWDANIPIALDCNPEPAALSSAIQNPAVH